jgi:hypothetical protein
MDTQKHRPRPVFLCATHSRPKAPGDTGPAGSFERLLLAELTPQTGAARISQKRIFPPAWTIFKKL